MNKQQLRDLAHVIRGESLDETPQTVGPGREREAGYRGGWNDATRRIAAKLDATANAMKEEG